MRRLTGLDIRLAAFRSSRVRSGYRRADVDEYLVMVAREIERYANDLARAEQALVAATTSAARTHAPPSGPESRAVASDVASTVLAARQQAAAILAEAHERYDTAARAEAEAELKLAHVEARLEERAQALVAEAQRLDHLARWLVDRDSMPLATPAHAAAGDAPGNAGTPLPQRAFRVVHDD